MNANKATRVRSIIPQLLTGKASTLMWVFSFVKGSGVGGVNGLAMTVLGLVISSISLAS